MKGTPEESRDLRVFVDSNILISALISSTSVASQFLTLVLDAHRLVLWDYGLTEMAQVIRRKFPKALPKWELFLVTLDFEMVHTPADLAIVAAPDIRDAKDRPILISALIAQPDAFVNGDQDFHTLEIAEYLTVYTPRQFLDCFGLR
ncbi:MAG: PIN domain-containing protein [Firmicutes bacterium]|nr:PIN domain-containing protein [Bacillota bacterium]